MELAARIAFLLLVFPCVAGPDFGQANIRPALVDSWVTKLGTELWNFGNVVTRRKEMQESFSDATVESREGLKLVEDIAKEIKKMMDLKVSAVRRIMDTAENSAMSSPVEGTVDPYYQYYNAKMLVQPGKGNGQPNGTRELLLTPNIHFDYVPVNISHSAVHVPTNVYDRSTDVIHGIKWSANLDETFVSNYKQDPTLSWQYFGSSTGFMRQFPAMEWKQEPVDLYDCRTRSWYIEAATSPKDVLILVDNSGSMMGQRKEIARHVVSNILDTLGNNDFVNIYSFVNETEEVVPCFKDKLLQANLANIRELKMGMENMKMASNIANFTIALTKAFELLEEYRVQRLGAACNQAIMLITDGVPYSFKEIFEAYNWKFKIRVRVFTYLIGQEVADVREVKWIACANQGYYVHMSTMAEVREKVLKYVPVMARPMVLGKNEHPIIWTPVYADVADPKMTDYLWERKEKAEQREDLINFRKDKNKFLTKEEQDRRAARKMKRVQDYNDEVYPYRMMTSVSIPVYDRRENANLTERVLINEAFWVLRTRETKVANLLGVAGTDVPNSDIKRLMVQHLLGVNAYAFMVTNNGYVLIHPDFRPVFQGLLKPSYNSIDVTDVELFDDENGPREFNPLLLALREKLINQSNGSVTFPVKYHYDGLRRVSQGKRRYYHNYIPGTPFELIVALPDAYGLNRVEGQVEPKRFHANSRSKISDFFLGKNWKIHPEWFYCKYHYDNGSHFKTREEELSHFIKKVGEKGWKWPLNRSSSPPEHQCDRMLLLSLVYDAKATEWFSGNISSASAEEKGKDMKQRFGLTLVFMATRSGLTRWQDISINSEAEEETSEPHFSEIHNKAIDETWYKRAVEQYYVDPESFVYSVPFDAGDDNDTLVTATHAIFHTVSSRQAPAAVVGFQFHHSALHARFINITSTCDQNACDATCAADSLDCYILDNNGYIIVSENREHTGMFFGEVKGGIMKALIEDNVYKKIIIYDYQAVCFREEEAEPSCSNKSFTPFRYLGWLFNWLFGHVLWLLVQTNMQWIATMSYSFTADDGAMYSETYEENSETPMPDQTMKQGERVITKAMIKRTRPQPCDMEIGLYQLQPEKTRRNHHTGSSHCSRSGLYMLYNVHGSNLVMIVVNALCGVEDTKISVTPVEVPYNDSSVSCHRAKFLPLSRRRPKECINTHPKEIEINLCGHGSCNMPMKSFMFLIFAGWIWRHL